MPRSLLSDRPNARRCSPAITRVMQRSHLTNTRCQTSLQSVVLKRRGVKHQVRMPLQLSICHELYPTETNPFIPSVPGRGPSYALQTCSGCGWNPQESVPLLQSPTAESQRLSAIRTNIRLHPQGSTSVQMRD